MDIFIICYFTTLLILYIFRKQIRRIIRNYKLRKYEVNDNPPEVCHDENTIKTTNFKLNNEATNDLSYSYQAKYLLTKNEWHEFKKLQNITSDRNWIICPKVRLADIIEPRREKANYKSLFYKIQAKHIDFLICDKNLRILAVLELDDNSHNKADRQKRDQFVDQILTGVGYTVIRTRSITEETLLPILKPTLAPGAQGGQG